MPTATAPLPAREAARLSALEAHVDRLAAHVVSVQRLADDFSGVALLLGSADFETYAIRSHLSQSKRWLAEYRSRLAAERVRVESESAA